MNFLHTIIHLGLAATLAAQIPQSMVFTAGTTARDGGGQDHAFMLWEAPGADLLGGKTFAVYGKVGIADAAVDYTQEGLISGSLQPAVITACLTQAAALGQNLDDFDSVLASIHYGCFYPDPAPPLNGDRAANVITVLTKARTLPNLVGKLRTLVMVNPTMALCLGMAWSAPMPASTKTYELREWDTAANADGPVIGRVTLTGGAPVILPAASRPVQVPDATPSGDLKVRLRWGVPDNLKRRIMLHQGFRLYRLPWALAQGYQNNAPDLTQLTSHITAGQAVLVTTKPLYLTKSLSPAQAEDLAAPLADQTIYLDDDLGRLSDPGNYVIPADGADYGYIVTPRDLLGRNGLPSQAGRGQILGTQAPPVPREARVDLVFGARNAQDLRPQHFHFSFLANENDAENPTTTYEVYRGTGQMVDGFGLPIPGNMIMPILHPALPGRLEHDDMPPYPFSAAQQVWFCVRAVRSSRAGTFFSPLSPPVYAALVVLEPPQTPSPVSIGNLCPQPGVLLESQSPVAADSVPDDDLNHFRMICDRLDSQVLKASFFFKRLGEPTEELLDEIEFSNDDRVQVDFTLPDDAVLENTTFICRVYDGESGLPPAEYSVVRQAAALQPDAVHELRFLAAVLNPTSLDPEHLVSRYFLNMADVKDVENLAIAPGRSPAITAHVENLPACDGFQVQRLFTAAWQPVGFGQSTVANVEDVVFMDSTATGPSTTATDYRLIPILNLRGCAANGFTYHTVTSRDGRANPVRNCLFYNSTPENEVLEYRFYRRVDDGPLTLYAEGRVKPGITPNPICVMDPIPPALGGTVHYYGQTVGANGVGSGVSYVRGVGAVSPTLPRPVLGAPQGSGSPVEPQVTLTWTCPAESVQRFEISLVPKGGEPVTNSVPAAAQGFVPQMRRRKLPFNSTISAASLFAPVVNVQTLATDRVGSAGLGSGPLFTQTLPIQANQDYDISLCAIGHNKIPGPDSAVYTFRWQLPPAPNDPDIPWPFRALPGISKTDGEVANMTLDEDYAEGPPIPDAMIWPQVTGGQVGFAIGSFSMNEQAVSVFYSKLLSGMDGVVLSPGSRVNNSSRDFNEHVFYRSQASNDRLLPAALYRQQLPDDAEWPEVSGDVVQVSPLVSKLLWVPYPDPGQDYPGSSFLRDPFIGVRYITGPLLPVIGAPNQFYLPDPTAARLYLLDTTPRAVGAKYRYWLVCFSKDTGAPEYVIPATLNKVTP